MRAGSLWSRNFTIITLGTVISAIGGTAMNLALSLVVFDKTGSTLLSGLYASAGVIPSAVLPVLVAPAVDRGNKKRLIVVLDYLSAAVMFVFLAFVRANGFVYAGYIVFSLVLGCISAVYGLAYDSLYPELIPEGFAQKGYAVSSLIYPLVTTVMSPAAALVYSSVGIEALFAAEGALLALAATCEIFIEYSSAPKSAGVSGGIGAYFKDIAEGVRYLKKEKGLVRIYAYMSFAVSSSEANRLMSVARFRTGAGLTSAMYSVLASAETLGRMLGAAVHYAVRIPEGSRYRLTVFVYTVYELFDGALLFFAFPVMLAVKFVLGFLGVNTATLRTAAVQSYLPGGMRARVNAVYNAVSYLGVLLVGPVAGALGEVMDYRVVAALFSALTLAAMLCLIVRGRESVEPVYSARTDGAD